MRTGTARRDVDTPATSHQPLGTEQWRSWTNPHLPVRRGDLAASVSRLVDDRTPVAKRWFDVSVAFVLLLLCLPGLILIAAVIKITSPGPVLFRQKRYGLGNRHFEILKFRTMFSGASDPSGLAQTRRHDSRVTPVGRLLRRSSLDELPQLWNVIRGDMSLVGPRPHVPGMLGGGVLYEELVPYYFERHRMRVGITGLAQVSGLRGSTVDPAIARARIDKDLEYIECWSFALDIHIIWLTVCREFLTGGAD